MLAGKNKSYDGPKTHRAIVTKIQADMKKRGSHMSFARVERMITLFFGEKYGIGKYFKKGNNFSISYLGTFKPEKKWFYKNRGERIVKRKKQLENWRIATAKYEKKKAEKEKS